MRSKKICFIPNSEFVIPRTFFPRAHDLLRESGQVEYKSKGGKETRVFDALE